MNTNLKKRGIEIDEICPRCGDSTEDTAHMLVYCQEAKKVWYFSPLRIDIKDNGRCSFKQWVSSLMDAHRDKEWWNVFWSLCWEIAEPWGLTGMHGS